MKVYFKVTTWDIVDIPDDLEEKVLNDLKSKEVVNSDQLFDKYKGVESILDVETVTQLSVKDNKGGSTIEVRNPKGEVIWDNVPVKTTTFSTNTDFTDDSPMPFGQHKDMPVGDLDAEYLLFLYRHRSEFLDDPKFPNNQKLKKYIEQNLTDLELREEMNNDK